MRGRSAIMACAGLALLSAGCDPLEKQYFRAGAGIEIEDAGALDTAQLQETYLGLLCQQAGLPAQLNGDFPVCPNLGVGNMQWKLVVLAGMNDIDRRCDGWLTWLDDRSRWANPVHQQILDTQTATTAILAATMADPVKAITVVAAAFGFASHTFSNLNNRLVFQLEKSTVQTLVLQRQQNFRNELAGRNGNPPIAIDNRAQAIYALRQYLRLCMPMTVETAVNATVKTFEAGGLPGLDAVTPTVDAGAVGSANATDTRPPAVIPRPPAAPKIARTAPGVVSPPAVTSSARIRSFWRANSTNERTVEQWLPAHGIGTSVTEFLETPGQEANRRKMIGDLRIP